jgi:hypothetical protein
MIKKDLDFEELEEFVGSLNKMNWTYKMFAKFI